MKFVSDNKNCFNTIELKLHQDSKEYKFDFTTPFRNKKQGFAKKPFAFSIKVDEDAFEGSGAFGQDALWLPFGNGYGIKIIRTNNDADDIIENLKYIKSIDSKIFPKISWFCKATIDNVTCVIAHMESIEDIDMNYTKPGFLPDEDFVYYQEKLNVPVQVIKQCVDEFIKHKLAPEDSWYKNSGFGTRNVIDGKIVDFHLFKHSPERYMLPVNDIEQNVCENIYKNALQRYANWKIKNNEDLPKWKGRIYQGMKFDNGYTMPGYSSDGRNFDSYIKSCFLPLDRFSNGKVLDIGSNQGFFSFQCALNGADDVTGVELTEEDVLLANEIKESILQLDNVNFTNGDAIKYLQDTEDWYELIVMSSVLHQTHPNLHECDDFLKLVASKCRYFFFETPVRHKHYDFTLRQITEKLEHHFSNARLVYFYDAYSTGYRAVYLCHPWDPPQNGPGIYEQMRKQGRVAK